MTTLLESERELQAVFDGVGDGLALFDSTGRITRVNRRVVEVGGYAADEIVGRRLDELQMFGRGDIAKMVSAFAPVLKGDDVPPLEMEVIAKNGERLVLDVRVAPLKKGDQIAGGIVVLRNISERKQAQMDLKESEKRYRLLAENVTDVIWVTDVNLQPMYVSPSIKRLMGFNADESLFRRMEDALSPSSVNKIRDIMAKLLVAGQDSQECPEIQNPVELELLHRDGSKVWVDTTVTILRDHSGNPIQFLGVLRNITQRRRVEEQLQLSLQKLEKTLEGTIQAIRQIVDTRDRYTAGHQQRVTELACAIAGAMGQSGDEIRAIHVAGLLHDVGKMMLPTEILTKPGRLNEIEFAMIRTHPKAGYNILASIEFPWPIATIVLQHHERMNGTGYPDGLCGEEILLSARILAVADVVEAMSSHRPYRPALGLDKALDEIIKNSSLLYDQRVVNTCVGLFSEGGFSFQTEAATDLF